MINPKVREHPHYDITDKMRKVYPNECEKWEKLLRKVSDSKNRGCFTCRFYNSPTNEFCDVESVDDNIDDEWLPWDTEEAYVWCDKFPDMDTSLKIGCSLWEQYKP